VRRRRPTAGGGAADHDARADGGARIRSSHRHGRGRRALVRFRPAILERLLLGLARSDAAVAGRRWQAFEEREHRSGAWRLLVEHLLHVLDALALALGGGFGRGHAALAWGTHAAPRATVGTGAPAAAVAPVEVAGDDGLARGLAAVGAVGLELLRR